MEDRALIAELAPTVADLMDRHLSQAKEWFPHELVPWSEGRDFAPGEEWVAPESAPAGAVRSALFVNLLTEDNLPYYSMEIHDLFGGDGPWGEWVRRWTAEEGRHSIVIRDWLTVTRVLDPWDLERARMQQVSGGTVPHPTGVLSGIAYVALQELATRISHHNTGKLLADKPGYEIMKRVAADENLHYLFYRDLGSAAAALDPSAWVLAVEGEVRNFQMPGTGIPDFSTHAAAIARAGIYDYLVHYERILLPVVMQKWGIDTLEGLSPEAEEARARIVKHIERVGRAGRRLRERAEELRAREGQTEQPVTVAV